MLLVSRMGPIVVLLVGLGPDVVLVVLLVGAVLQFLAMRRIFSKLFYFGALKRVFVTKLGNFRGGLGRWMLGGFPIFGGKNVYLWPNWEIFAGEWGAGRWDYSISRGENAYLWPNWRFFAVGWVGGGGGPVWISLF